MALHDPRDPEHGPPEGGDARPGPDDHVDPIPLGPTDRVFLLQALARRQDRRRTYRAGPLWVWWDGEKRLRCDLRGGMCEPFRIPLHVSSVEIVGDDAEGALLLAVFPLPTPEAVVADGASHFSVPLEGGQMVALAVALDGGLDGEARAYILRLTYTDLR